MAGSVAQLVEAQSTTEHALAFGRRVGFALTLATVVALYTTWLVDALPPLRDEGRELVVVPATAIAALVLAAIHPAVVRASSHALRLALLVVATGVAMLLYTATLMVAFDWLAQLEEPLAFAALRTAGFALLVLAAQVLYGAPLFVAVAVVAKLTSRVLVGRPATAVFG